MSWIKCLCLRTRPTRRKSKRTRRSRFTGIGGVSGQFVIQGGLAVGEMYSIAALNNNVSSIGIEQVVATFLFSGFIGALGSKNAASDFKRIGDIESNMLKYSARDILRNGKSIVEVLSKRGIKYFNVFLKPYVKNAFLTAGISAMANFANYWIQKLYENNN